jgi:hypothetical protein
METVVSKRVTDINNPHIRLGAYLDLVELISGAYGDKANPRSSYLTITAERDEIPENEYLGNQPVGEIREYLKQVKIIDIESSIPSTFVIGNRLWLTKGEGVVMYGVEVSLSCPNLETDEVRDLQKLVRKSSKDYAIEFAGKRIYGES